MVPHWGLTVVLAAGLWGLQRGPQVGTLGEWKPSHDSCTILIMSLMARKGVAGEELTGVYRTGQFFRLFMTIFLL